MKPQTLVDAVYRASFTPQPIPGWKSNLATRRALESAQRFVLDAPMAAFMADLANEAFLRPDIRNTPVVYRILDSLRVSARLPHEAIWIEYPLHAYQIRSNVIRSMGTLDLHEIPQREGWLIQQDPQVETAYIMHLFTSDSRSDEHGFSMWTFPLAFGWCCDDRPLPWWAMANEVGSEIIVGVSDYRRANVNIVSSPLLTPALFEDQKHIQELLYQWCGVLRRVWALLATIDNIPMARAETRITKGFLARGQIRKYLSHRTITLNVPARTNTTGLARKLIAGAHRKRHGVRGHWRDDWRYPPSPSCKPHLWEAMDDDVDRIECSLCHGRQSFIHKHERGDAALGYVTHSYRVTHDKN